MPAFRTKSEAIAKNLFYFRAFIKTRKPTVGAHERIQGGPAPKISSKSCSFQGILRENPLFWANFRLRAPPLGVKTPLGPPWPKSWIRAWVPHSKGGSDGYRNSWCVWSINHFIHIADTTLTCCPNLAMFLKLKSVFETIQTDCTKAWNAFLRDSCFLFCFSLDLCSKVK